MKIGSEQGSSDQDHNVTGPFQISRALGGLLNVGDCRQEDVRRAHEEDDELDAAPLDIQPVENLMFEP